MEGTIQQLFEGHHMNYIECINVDYKSTRKESFYGTYFIFMVEMPDLVSVFHCKINCLCGRPSAGCQRLS